ncbi:hypothetical protein B9Z55_007562 [Caenorhabditis nigoni]|uniref:Uncharacterized protein n=1 Tax=Caenorhabditis nigoni TaxID=1611254 RepID=A0A2G5VAA8_9PELO|nr:hypothetical protein B9Z55_007562 [Caenorhabditis nigoni]
MDRSTPDDVIYLRQKAKSILQQGSGCQGPAATPTVNQRASRRRSPPGCSSPVTPGRHVRSVDAPAITLRSGRRFGGKQGSPVTNQQTPSDAQTSTRRGRSTQRTPAMRASRRRSFSRYASSSQLPPYRRSTSVSQPSLREATEKAKKAARKRPAPYKAFGCRRRKSTQDSAKRSSGAVGFSTTAAPSGSHRDMGRLAVTGATTVAPSGQSPATMRITGAPQPKKRRTAT